MKLYPHQEKALKDTASFDNVAYYLDMGLGKTYIGSEKAMQYRNELILVICQKSKIDDWVNHFEENYRDTWIYNLTKKKQFDIFIDFAENIDDVDNYTDGNYPNYFVGVINYELAWRRSELLNLNGFTLILDESSLIQNETAKRTKFVMKLKANNVILLSGTPCSGKYEQLWSQSRLLGWDINKRNFYRDYIITRQIDVGGFYKDIVVGYKNVEMLKNNLRQHGAVFMKTDEVIGLPEQIDKSIEIPITRDYKYFDKNSYINLPEEELVGDNTFTKILGERKLCGMYNKDKLSAFKDLLDSTNDRIIVFYNFTAELNKMLTIVKDRPVSIINGQTKQTDNYENCDNSVTFVQYQAGAMGLNLQKANKIIYFTLPLGKGSSAMWEQSKKRIHRIGQNRPCFYYYLICKNSIEEWNLKLLKKGVDLTNELFRQNT